MAGQSRRSAGVRCGWLAIAIAFLAGCSTNVRLKDTRLPDALVEPYPLTVGLRFGKDIEAFSYEETLPAGGKYTIDLGRASALMFRSTLDDMFAAVVAVPSGDAPPEGIDLLIEPSLVALEFAVPAQTVTKDYAVWIRYQVKVYDADGKLQADYPMSAYGKAARESMMGGTQDALQSAASLAIRDAAVLLLTGFERDAKLSTRQLAGLAAADTPTGTTAETPPKPEPPVDAVASPADNAEKFL